MRLPKSAQLKWASEPGEYERGAELELFYIPRRGRTGGYYILRTIETLMSGYSTLRILSESEADNYLKIKR